MIATKTPKTPLPTLNFSKFEGKASVDQIHGYQQKIGSLNFAAVTTRPDISYSISKLSEFLQNPGPIHIHAADHLLIYLAATKDYSITFDGKTKESKIFLTWSDSSYADDVETRYSSAGFCLQLYGGTIHYKATKIKTVVTSSTHAELLSLSQTAKELQWWKRFFKNLGFDLEQEPAIHCDNKQTIRLLESESSRLQTNLKHIDVHQCWLRQEVKSGNIRLIWVPTTDMVADGFTKLLPPQRHNAFVNQLGLKFSGAGPENKSTQS